MISRSDHGADAVYTSWETIGNSSLQKTFAVPGIIYALEESEGGWVGRSSRLESTDILDRDVAVTNDVAVLIQVLWCGIVVRGWVNEEACVEMLGLNGDVEGCVCWDFVADLWVGDHGCDHVLRSWDLAHWNTVTGSRCDLQAVCYGLARTEVDKVGVITVALRISRHSFAREN